MNEIRASYLHFIKFGNFSIKFGDLQLNLGILLLESDIFY